MSALTDPQRNNWIKAFEPSDNVRYFGCVRTHLILTIAFRRVLILLQSSRDAAVANREAAQSSNPGMTDFAMRRHQSGEWHVPSPT
jgi:hypothetical protein